MSSKRRELIVLSDGTSNSASKPFKTNVWRLYQALNLRDGTQVAVFGDGVGNSSITILRVLGLALGFGVKRNVLNLYKFLCHNYRPGQDPDRIWMFGFSRGAFTIRVLAGLIDSQGLVTFKTESELNQNAIAAYRAYRAKEFKTKLWWVRLGRWCRDTIIHYWRRWTGGTQYEAVLKRWPRIHFIGVWDTVAAYGLPIDELTIACNRWVWPMQFDRKDLLKTVDNARHAMGLDDERRTFHPIPWSEDDEKELQADKEKCKQFKVPADRLLQVWFPGMHADVGGGYPDDGLSLMPLCWMIDEAAAKELKFEPDIVKLYRAQASPTGRLYDSRSGFGVLWRYQPRNVQFLMDDREDNPAERITPLVHYSAVTRMTYGNDGYAPISLPLDIKILLPNVVGRLPLAPDATVSFNKDAIAAALKNPKDDETRTVLENLAILMARKDTYEPKDYFDLVADTVWLRRCAYFLTLGLALTALAFPLIYQALGWDDNSAKANQIASGTLSYFAGLFKGMLPAFATPWVDAATSAGTWAIAIVVGFLLSLALSKFLELRIHDRARGAWNVQPETGGTGDGMNRLKLSGQRRGLATMTFIFAGATVASLAVLDDEHRQRLYAVAVFFAAFVVCAASWAYRVWHPEDDANPAHPRWALRWARKLRKNPDLVDQYRWVARTGAPAFFFAIVAILVIGGINLTLFNVQSTMGNFCKQPKVDYGEPIKTLIATGRYEKPGTATDVSLNELCASTGLWLVAGREYRIQIEQQEPWFNEDWPTDVTGLKAGWSHLPYTPLKRWWTREWFQPVVRVGNVGNYEYPLVPTSPLPKVDFKDAYPASAPATKAEAEALVQVEQRKGVFRNKVLIADIVPKSSGELYFYVNDAILAVPPIQDLFYRNNIGKAKITVTRTLAPDVIEAKN